MPFDQPAPRSPLPAILAAVAILAAIAAALFYFNPHDTAALSVSDTVAIPTRTNFKSDSTVIQSTPAGQDDLYVLTTLRIADHLRLPVTLDTITATLVTADDQQTTTSAIPSPDLPAVFLAFPQLKPYASPALLRETEIAPGTAAIGQIVLHFPIKKQVWDTRKSAILTVSLYHQTPQAIEIR